MWAELEQASGERLNLPSPQLTFGPLVGQVREALELDGAPLEMLSAAEAAARFGGINLEGVGDILYEPESAVTLADRALAVLAARVQVQVRRVTGVEPRRSGVRVRMADGEDLDANVAIVCAGPWTGRLVAPAGITVPGTTSLEQVAYFVPSGGGAGGLPPPIIINYGGDFPYGLPVPGTNRYKLGIHMGGPSIDPDDQDQSVDARLAGQIRRRAAQFLPGFDPAPVAVERCIYDNSPDTNFIIDRIGDIVIGCGTSGHGFKFGPLLGEWLAELATDQRDGKDRGGQRRPPAWFGLNRFASGETAPAPSALLVDRGGPLQSCYG